MVPGFQASRTFADCEWLRPLLRVTTSFPRDPPCRSGTAPQADSGLMNPASALASPAAATVSNQYGQWSEAEQQWCDGNPWPEGPCCYLRFARRCRPRRRRSPNLLYNFPSRTKAFTLYINKFQKLFLEEPHFLELVGFFQVSLKKETWGQANGPPGKSIYRGSSYHQLPLKVLLF